MGTISITAREFREKQASFLDEVRQGRELVLSRKVKGVKERYMIIKIDDDDLELSISPKLQLKIDDARAQYKRGEMTSCKSLEELNSFLDSL